MKGTELIPATEEESRAVTVEPVGTSIAPTVQVSLAKRIVHPRTNKVVCLAAQTEVPMEEDELASVSDLALRLSDGTNVRLSMSFFNENLVPASFMPGMARKAARPEPPIYTYDPERYETHRAPDQSWRLALVFGGICAITLGSFFYFVPGGFERAAAKIIAAMPPTIAPAASDLLKPQAWKAPPPGITAGTFKTRGGTAKTERQAKSLSRKSQSSRHASRKNTRSRDYSEQTLVDQSSKLARRSKPSRTVLVPPPPPTMAFPLNQMQMFSYAPYAVPGQTPQSVRESSGQLSPAEKAKANSLPKVTEKPVDKPVTKQSAMKSIDDSIEKVVEKPSAKSLEKSAANALETPPEKSLQKVPAQPASVTQEPKPNRLLQSIFQLQADAARTPARSHPNLAPQSAIAAPRESRNIFTDNDAFPISQHSTKSSPAPQPGDSSSEQLERIVLP
ncbi:hypothetical protein KF728_12425 [Candidatus Obscuribacterales bacterium]|nr:hypothetical protein [Candidatus Obscuribacterales bacterium]MBX3150947.1 hypothetical protein [Candidatus Obscuribacterales bacterium]